ncbi:MAG: hypothetical protein LBK50_02065 [Candidatus Nomurabacteria bacterium]|jgi:hypothetical protein|nr:hypothetical protein [Candidatus Nomurabacteria bacterium]
MIGLIIVISVFVILFLLAFVTRRRFGLLGLGLAAGVLLNQLVGNFVVDAISLLPFDFTPLTAKDISTLIVTILPSLLLFIGGPKTTNKVHRLLNSLIYALIATTLIIFPITTAFPVEDPIARNILTLLDSIQLPILTFGIIVAIVDILAPRKKEK